MNRGEWFVDAGYWIAWINGSDAWHARARRLASGLRRPLVTTEAILLEVGDAFAGVAWRIQVAAFLERLRANPNITIVPVDADLAGRALALYAARSDKTWGLTDCVSFVVMQDRGITDALAADQHFIQAGFRALLREP
jgi:uncharacterized protein